MLYELRMRWQELAITWVTYIINYKNENAHGFHDHVMRHFNKYTLVKYMMSEYNFKHLV